MSSAAPLHVARCTHRLRNSERNSRMNMYSRGHNGPRRAQGKRKRRYERAGKRKRGERRRLASQREGEILGDGVLRDDNEPPSSSSRRRNGYATRGSRIRREFAQSRLAITKHGNNAYTCVQNANNTEPADCAGALLQLKRFCLVSRRTNNRSADTHTCAYTGTINYFVEVAP